MIMLLLPISLLSYNYPFFCCLKLIYHPIVHCLSEVVYMEEYILKTFKTIKRKITMHYALISLFLSSYFFLCFSFSSMNFFASFIKLNTISTITAPIGNAAMILTDCRLLIELSENTSAIGRRISRIHHIS